MNNFDRCHRWRPGKLGHDDDDAADAAAAADVDAAADDDDSCEASP